MWPFVCVLGVCVLLLGVQVLIDEYFDVVFDKIAGVIARIFHKGQI